MTRFLFRADEAAAVAGRATPKLQATSPAAAPPVSAAVSVMAANRESTPGSVGLPVGDTPVVTAASGPPPVLVVSATVAATGTAATGAADFGVSVSVEGVAGRAGAAAPPAPPSIATPDAVLAKSLIGPNAENVDDHRLPSLKRGRRDEE